MQRASTVGRDARRAGAGEWPRSRDSGGTRGSTRGSSGGGDGGGASDGSRVGGVGCGCSVVGRWCEAWTSRGR